MLLTFHLRHKEALNPKNCQSFDQLNHTLRKKEEPKWLLLGSCFPVHNSAPLGDAILVPKHDYEGEKMAPPPKEAPIFKTAPQGSCFSSTFFLSVQHKNLP